MNRPETNPYLPTSTPNLAAVPSPRRQRRFTILNSLLAVPGIVLLVLYIVNASSNHWETDPASGDPVTYQHFVWIDVEPQRHNISSFPMRYSLLGCPFGTIGKGDFIITDTVACGRLHSNCSATTTSGKNGMQRNPRSAGLILAE